MSQPEQLDVLILGSGQGGKLLAWHVARAGRRAAVVERQWVGGSCPAVACMPSNVLRTEATDETQGFMKILVSASDDRILGFTMIGSDAGEVLAAVQTAMLAKLPYATLCDAVITHLTVAEGLGPVLAQVPAPAG